jgi:hypothetical protein
MDEENPILVDITEKVWRSEIKYEAPFNLEDLNSSTVDYGTVIPFLKQTYRSLNVNNHDVNIFILPERQFMREVPQFALGCQGICETDLDDINIKLLDIGLLGVLSLGFHECGEHLFEIGTYDTMLSNFLGYDVTNISQALENDLDDYLHDLACFVQLITTEKCELDNPFLAGKLRVKTKQLFSDNSDYQKDGIITSYQENDGSFENFLDKYKLN